MIYRSILVAMDFSPFAQAALQQALWLARLAGAQVKLAHVMHDLQKAVRSVTTAAKYDIIYGDGSKFDREVRAETDARLQRLVAGLNAEGVDLAYETLLGTPFVELTHAVQREGHDLVLAGTRGLSTWQQFFVGSTSKRLIRNCPADVWITKGEHVHPPQIVLASTDFSEASRRAVERAMSLAQASAGAFHLLHVIDSSDVPDDLAEHIPEGSSMRQEIQHTAQQRFEEFIASLNAGSLAIERHLSWGTPWQEIGRLAGHVQADLVAMGTIGRSGIQGVLLGNTAERVLDHCDSSVLVVKPADFVSPIVPAAE
jgi:universal stress protein E